MKSTAEVPAGTTGPGRLLRATLLASSTLTIMAAAVIAPSLPAMRQVFADSPAADTLVRLALTVTSLTIGLTAPAAGLVTDRLGRKPVLVAALMLYAVAGVAGFFLSDLTAILVTRAFLGIAVGGIMTAVSALIVDLFDGPRRGAFLGLQAAFASLGGIVFLPLGGVLAEISWHAPFWIYAVSLAVVPFAVLSVPGSAMASVGGARRSNVVADEVGRRTRWRVLGLYGLAFAGTLVFFMAPTQLPFALQRFHVAPTVTGLVIAGSTVTSAIAALGYTRVRQRLSLGAVNALSLALLGAGWVVVGTAGTLLQLVLGVLVGGFGVGLVIPNLNLWLSELVPPSRRGRALGGLVAAIFLGQFGSPLVLQPLTAGLGIAATFTVTGIATVAAAVVLAVAPARREPAQPLKAG